MSNRSLLAGALLVAAQMPAQSSAQDTRSATATAVVGASFTVLPTVAAVTVSGDNNIARASLFASGLIFGPMTSYAYAGAPRRGVRGAVLRTAVLGATAAAVVQIDNADDDLGASLVAGLVGAVGAGYVGLMALRDVANATRIVRDQNRAGMSRLSVAPGYVPSQRALGITGRLTLSR